MARHDIRGHHHLHADPDEEIDYDLVPAPGAIVIFEPDGTTVTGVG